MLNRPMFVCSVILGFCSMNAFVCGQNPTHACPQWEWGNTGNIYHYYSEMIDNDHIPCLSLYWDNLDGPQGMDLTGSCGNAGACHGPLLRQIEASQQRQGDPQNATTMKKPGPHTKPGSKLNNVPTPNQAPKLDPRVATIKDDFIAEVYITANQAIKAKLYIARIDLRGQAGHDRKPPMLVANGFQCDPSSSADITVRNDYVQAVEGEEHVYEVTVGPVVYRLITNTPRN